jgi:hypothetical protein
MIAITAVGLALRLTTLPLGPDMEDSIFFVRGVIRFSIKEIRPHWPGYPVYIWVGKLATVLVRDPVRALHLVSAVASTLVAWPLAHVARAWALSLGFPARKAVWAGWTAAALWLVTPVAWVTGSQIVSDSLGLLCGMSFLALCVMGERDGSRWWMGAAALGGVLGGVRFANVSMLAPLLWESWRARRARWHGLPVPVALLAALLAGALPWILWLGLREPVAFVQVGRSMLKGHFTRWGESVFTDAHPLERPLRLAETLAVYGVGAGPPRLEWTRVVVGAAWLGAVVAAFAARPSRSGVARLVALWAAPHFVHVFLFHNAVHLPRYMLPAVALLSLIGGLAAVMPRRAGRFAVILALASTAMVSAPLAVRQRRQPPPEYRVAEFLGRIPRAGVVVVGTPSLPFYLDEVAPGVAYATAEATEIPKWEARWISESRRVFATAPPPQDPSGWHPVAHYCRDPLIAPLLGGEVWLFAPTSAGPGRPLACGEEE